MSTPSGKLLAAVLIAAAGASACATTSEAERRAAIERSLHAIDPNAEPLPPKDPPADGKPELDTEYYLGSKSLEESRFRAFGQMIQAIQDQGAKEHGQPVQRGFHAKSHGCLHGTFRLAPDRAARTRYGIFADGQPDRPVWVRFSNGVGWKQGDSTLDARGMAMKVMRVPGPKYMDEQLTQDFLMTNSPTPVGRDAEEFMEFARANVNGRAAGLFFLIEHPRTGAPALLRTGAVDSVVTTQYWSGGAYHLGAHQAIKYTAKPCPGTPERHPSHDPDDYLHADLVAVAKERGACMRFYVQFQYDAEATPIENASKEWDEKLSPLVPVGDVVMPPQDVDAPGMKAFCDALSFNPWHAIGAHKPMGHINRARRTVYGMSAAHRKSGPEPTPFGEASAPPAP